MFIKNNLRTHFKNIEAQIGDPGSYKKICIDKFPEAQYFLTSRRRTSTILSIFLVFPSI